MRKFVGILCALLVAIVFLLPATAIASAEGTVRVIVHASDANVRTALVSSMNVRHDFGSLGFTVDLPASAASALDARPGVSVEKVAVYQISKPPSKPPAPRPVPSDPTPWGIETMYGDPAITSTSGGAGVSVAVLDTGVTTTHPDLSRRIAQCIDFTVTPRGGQEPLKVGQCADKNGHGTHVAGTILADGGADGKGIWGVAPAASLFAYKVCGSSSCWSDDIAYAIRYAADHGANIISMSLGSDADNTLERDAIAYAVGQGVLLVAAAGNDGPADGSIDYPGANVNVVAVGAIDSSWNVASWSSRGINDHDYIVEEREVEFGAPGVSVESTWKDGGYYVFSGTSMATPHISGFAAKMWQGSASATRDCLHGMAQDIWTSGDDTATGFGLPHL